MIKPIRTNVLVECLELENISEGGIHVPDSFKRESDKVKVIEVGNGASGKPMRFKRGDIAHRVQGWGTPIEENGRRFYLMEQDALIATE